MSKNLNPLFNYYNICGQTSTISFLPDSRSQLFVKVLSGAHHPGSVLFLIFYRVNISIFLAQKQYIVFFKSVMLYIYLTQRRTSTCQIS